MNRNLLATARRSEGFAQGRRIGWEANPVADSPREPSELAEADSAFLGDVGRRLRFQPEPGLLVELTFTTAERRLFLRPSRAVNEIVAGVLAMAAERYGVWVVAVAALSTHMHLLAIVRDTHQQRYFAQYVASNIAREINRLLGRTGHFWERRYVAIPTEGVDKEEERLEYALSQGVKEGLVARVLQWPGIGSAAALLSGRSIEGIWEDRTKAWQLRRQGQRVRRKDVVRKTSLSLVPLPAWRDLTETQRRAKVLAMVQKIETEAKAEREQAGRQPMGRDKILRQSPLSTPATSRKPSPAPLFHARGEIFLRLLHAYREFKAAFRQAAELLRTGDKNAPFPPGSFPPGLPFVRGKPPPFATQPA